MNERFATMIAALAVASTAASGQTSVTVKIENLAPANGGYLTPVWVGFHDGGFDVYDNQGKRVYHLTMYNVTVISWSMIFQIKGTICAVYGSVNIGPIFPRKTCSPPSAKSSTGTCSYPVFIQDNIALTKTGLGDFLFNDPLAG